MAIKNNNRGFSLLVAVIFMSVMLSFGLALGSLAYKQQVLASGSIESQYAFYAADAALECTLYADQQLGTFNYSKYPGNTNNNSSAPNISCNGAALPTPFATLWYSSGTSDAVWVTKARFSVDATRCADVTVYKYATPQANHITTYLFSQGYDVSCGAIGGGGRVVTRGLYARY